MALGTKTLDAATQRLIRQPARNPKENDMTTATPSKKRNLDAERAIVNSRRVPPADAKKALAVALDPKSPKSVTLPYVRSTPGTHVYGVEPVEGQKPPICKQVYLARGELPDPAPDSITLTVAWK
jgi:hypothetical protein